MANKIKKAVRKAGNNISNKEMDKIVKKSGGSTSKALDKISSVQQSRSDAGKTAPSIGSKAANNLIKQAQSNPANGYLLGSSTLAQSVRDMAGTPAGPMIKGKRQPGTPPAGLGYVPGGMTIRPSGRLGVGPKKDKSTPKSKDNGRMSGPYDGMLFPEVNLDGPGPLANPNTQTWLGYTDPEPTDTDPIGTDPINPTVNPSSAQSGAGAETSSTATSWRGKKGSRYKASKNAQGTNSMTIASNAAGVGINPGPWSSGYKYA